VLTPIGWLAALEAAYALSYWTCDSPRWSLIPVALSPVPLGLAVGALILATQRPWPGSQPEETWPAWLAWLGLLTILFFIVVSFAMAVPVLGLRPCHP
jgi:hypothetical protein